MSNYRNLLQEICQKNNLIMPFYKSTASGRDDMPVWISTVTFNGIQYKSDPCKTRKSANDNAAQKAYENVCETPIYLSNKKQKQKHTSQSPVVHIRPATRDFLPHHYPTYQEPIQSTHQPQYTEHQPSLPLPPLVAPSNFVSFQDFDKNHITLNVPFQDPFNSMQYVKPNAIIFVDLENIQPAFEHPVNIEIHYFKSSYSSISCDNLPGTVHIIDSAYSDAADHLLTFETSRIALLNPDKDIILVSRDKFSGVLSQILRESGTNVTHVKSSHELLSVLDLVPMSF